MREKQTREDASGVRKKPVASSARSSGRRGTAKKSGKIDVGKRKKASKNNSRSGGRIVFHAMARIFGTMFKTLLVCLVLLVIGGAGFGAYKLIPLKTWVLENLSVPVRRCATRSASHFLSG